MSEAVDRVVSYPGGLRARYRWAGSGQAAEVFALSEAGGALVDLGPRVSLDPDAVCRAELRVDTPSGAWTVRLASTIFDEPAGLAWDVPGLLVVKYGFHVYGLGARDGEARWIHRSATPVLSLHGSARLEHVVAVAEIETVALDAAGALAWRIGHSDVVSAAELVGGRLVLTSYGGDRLAIDPATGRTLSG